MATCLRIITITIFFLLFPFLTLAQWSLRNQVNIEDRPYTHPSFARENVWQSNPKLKRNTFYKILYPKLRDMHRNCDGQCFYAPYECINAEGLQEDLSRRIPKYKCPVIASIATHGTDDGGKLICDYFGVTDNLRESFCETSDTQKRHRSTNNGSLDKFYTITLHRTILDPIGTNNVFDFFETENGKRVEVKKAEVTSCPKKWNDATGRRCTETEFIGISFIRSGSPELPAGRYLHENDTWYICTARESAKSRVTTWSQITDEENSTLLPQQIIGTSPHLSSGMGVVFSKVFFDEEHQSFGCQFVIQESNMTLSQPPAHTAFFSEASHRPIQIKLAVGFVDRDDSDRISQPFDPNRYHLVFMGKESPNGIAPTNVIDFDQIKVVTKPRSADISKDIAKEEENLKKINDILRLCDNPRTNFPHLYVACYPPNEQPNCIHTGKCSAMFIVELPREESSRDFKTIKAHLYSNLPDHKSLRKVIRPKGFVAVGFSLDDHMDRDVVVTCHADGLYNITTHVSINYDHSNIYPGHVDYNHLIQNSVGLGIAEKNRILCSWEMNTAFQVNMFSYMPFYREVIPLGYSEKLDFDFTANNYTLLLSAGNRNYPGGVIVFHDFAQVLKERFGKHLFFNKAGGVGTIGGDFLIIISLFTLFRLVVLFVFSI